jgi:hypothetical protein
MGITRRGWVRVPPALLARIVCHRPHCWSAPGWCACAPAPSRRACVPQTPFLVRSRWGACGTSPGRQGRGSSPTWTAGHRPAPGDGSLIIVDRHLVVDEVAVHNPACCPFGAGRCPGNWYRQQRWPRASQAHRGFDGQAAGRVGRALPCGACVPQTLCWCAPDGVRVSPVLGRRCYQSRRKLITRVRTSVTVSARARPSCLITRWTEIA